MPAARSGSCGAKADLWSEPGGCTNLGPCGQWPSISTVTLERTETRRGRRLDLSLAIAGVQGPPVPTCGHTLCLRSGCPPCPLDVFWTMRNTACRTPASGSVTVLWVTLSDVPGRHPMRRAGVRLRQATRRAGTCRYEAAQPGLRVPNTRAGKRHFLPSEPCTLPVLFGHDTGPVARRSRLGGAGPHLVHPGRRATEAAG